MKIRLALGVIPTVLLLSSLGMAQSDGATISGRVTDDSGYALLDVQLSMTNLDTRVKTTTRTNSQGVYVVHNLHPGEYRLVASKEGFREIVLTGLVLDLQAAINQNFTMQIGSVIHSVTVTAGGKQFDISPAVSTLVNEQFVQNIPLNGRSFQSLIQLTPGVLVTPSSQSAPGQFSVNGQRTNTNYFLVDGVSANFGTTTSVAPIMGGPVPALTIGGGTNGLISAEAMLEFRVQTSTYSPEFGRSPGAQIAIVTNSGGNQFHGTVYDYLRNDVFDARNWFNRPPLPKPPLRQNDFGATLGGPIIGNRTFFFFSYEGLRLRQPQTNSGYFYTKAARAAVAPVYQPFVNALPLPNGPLADPSCDNILKPCLAKLAVAYSDPSSFDSYSLRLDHSFNRRLTLFARYSRTPSTQGFRSFSNVEYDTADVDTATAGATISISPTKANDFRANWSRFIGKARLVQDAFGGALVPPDPVVFRPGDNLANSQAAVSFPNAGQSFDVGTRTANIQRQLNFIDTLSMYAGEHQLKFGVDFRQLRLSNQGNNSYGLTLTNFNQLRAGTMGVVGVIASDVMTVRLDNWSLFAQDTWQALTRLTLTYGLRWDANTPPESTNPDKPLYAVEGIFDSKPLALAPAGTPLWHTRYNNFAPRLGAAYQLTSKTVLRGGLGIFYDLGYGGELERTLFGFPYYRVRTTSAVGRRFDLTNAVFQAPAFSTAISSDSGIDIAAFDPDLRVPLTWQWNAALERQLGMNQSLSFTYVGATGERLLRADVVTPPAMQTVGPGVATTYNAGHSRYNAMQVQFQHRMSRGLQVLASYNLAKSYDTGSDDLIPVDSITGSGSYAASVNDIQLPPLTRSDFDVRHSLAAAFSYEIPAPSWGKAMRAVLKDWMVDGIVRASTPLPLNVRIGGVSPTIGHYMTQPNLVPGQTIWQLAPGEPGGKVLNPDAFTLPAIGTTGDFIRNSLRSPFGISQADIAIRRRFNVGERITLDFRVEYFNVFNHPMFGGPEGPWTFWGYCQTTPCTGHQIAGFGRVSPSAGTLNQGLGGGGLGGGQSELYAIGGPRSGQFTVKLQF